MSKSGRAYFNGNILNITSPAELSDFVSRGKVRSPNTPEMNLADVYSRNITLWSRGGINIHPSSIIEGMKTAEIATRETKNSMVDSLELPQAKYNGRQWVFNAPATMIVVDPKTGRNETVRAWVHLGIKPNCMNLQPIALTYEGSDRWYDITNGTSKIPLGIPLMWTPQVNQNGPRSSQ